MDAHGIGEGCLEDVRALSGGTQNVMIAFTRGGDSFVLRRGPVVPPPSSDDTIRREVRLLTALAGTDVPHARLVTACDSPDVLGSAFYLMEAVEGFNAAEALPPAQAHRPELRRRMVMTMVDGLAHLAQVDPSEVGLQGFGRPEGFLERQTERWLDQLARIESADHDGPTVVTMRPIADWLDRHRPRASAPGILHGDFHVANVMFDEPTSSLAAIVDWELATIGDPLLDLGTLLALWPAADGQPDLLGSALSLAGGLPSESELVERYAASSGRQVGDIDYYYVLGCFRLAVLLEGTCARARVGRAPAEVGRRLHTMAAELVQRGARRVAETPADRHIP
ncbi:phosphotransferase family protein [Micromonospora olivasterospora]|nr:phosphotransferase family protein [Micromonospora olivasterospora]